MAESVEVVSIVRGRLFRKRTPEKDASEVGNQRATEPVEVVCGKKSPAVLVGSDQLAAKSTDKEPSVVGNRICCKYLCAKRGAPSIWDRIQPSIGQP
ncbi:MAG: hypothetical protein KTR25_03165 [Myxococcales bacterium]|nr:hypothetical protein [Myxococcales bacterium]